MELGQTLIRARDRDMLSFEITREPQPRPPTVHVVCSRVSGVGIPARLPLTPPLSERRRNVGGVEEEGHTSVDAGRVLAECT